MKKRYFETIWFDSPRADQAQAELQLLLGAPDGKLELGNVCLAVRSAVDSQHAGTVAALSLHSSELSKITDTRKLQLICAESQTEAVREFDSSVPGIQAIDHIVLQTNNADDCIRLFGEELGMRLALDQTVEKWGGRMLFFREGGLTLEVIHNFEKPVEQDRFWGVCYRCAKIEKTHQALVEKGVELSEIREGRKPGTRVATIKSHCANIPSLLIE